YNGTTTVLAGVLSLDKPDGVASFGDVFNASALVVGDDVSAPGSARVVLGSNEQVLNGEIVTVNRSGVLDLAGHDETFFRLVMGGGTVETGAGTLNLTGILETSGASATSTINGKLNFTGTSASWRIADNPTVDDDLVVNAVISGPSNTATMGF